MLTDTELQALSDELDNDPDALGYTGDDAGDADLLNEIRSQYTVWRPTVDGGDVVAETVPGEWEALSEQEKRRYDLLTGASGGVKTGKQNVRDAFAAMFGPDTTTRANLIAVAQREASRAEDLFGRGTRVTPSDVADARRI